LTGDVIIDKTASGTITLDGVQSITGGLSCQNASQITELGGDSLETIGGAFDLRNLTILSALKFNSLTSVNEISWIGLPALQGLNFAQGVSGASDVLISDTQLNNLDGIELQSVYNLGINNNPFLTTINMSDLSDITGSLDITANSKDLTIALPGLQHANNMTFKNVSAVSMPELVLVNGSLGLYSGTMLDLSIPNLVQTGGDLALVDCDSVDSLSLPALAGIGGGFLLLNNSQLSNITIPTLQVVAGAIDFVGDFSR
jgi:hypothetical protein